MERSLVDRLRDSGYLTADDGERADRESAAYPSVAECLVHTEILEEGALRRAIGRMTSAPAIDLVGKTIEPEVLAMVSADVSRKHRCLPLFVNESQGRRVLFLGLEDPAQTAPQEEVGRFTGFQIEPVVVGPIQLTDALERFYPASMLAQSGQDEVLPAAAPDDERAGEAEEVHEVEAIVDPVATADEAVIEGEPLLEAAVAADAPEIAEAPSIAEAPEREPETPTRIILQALTKTLIASGVIESSELMAEVHRIQEKERA